MNEKLKKLAKRAKQNIRLRRRNTPRHYYERVFGLPRFPEHQYNSRGNSDATQLERSIGFGLMP